MKKNRVDLVLTKNWGGHEKGHVLTNLNRAFARSIQDVEKAGKIIGDTKSQADLDNELSIQEAAEKDAEEIVNAVKEEAEGKVLKADSKIQKAEEALNVAKLSAKKQADKHKVEISEMKKNLQTAEKKATNALKAQKVAENKMDKLVKERSTK